MQRHLKGTLQTAIGVLVLTPDALLVRLVQADVWALVFWRGALQFIALLLFLLCLNRRKAWASFVAIGWGGIAIALMYALGNLAFIHSLKQTEAANTLLIISSSPLLSALLSRLFLKEHVPLRTWLAACGAFVGIGIITSGSIGAGALTGDLLAFGAAISLAASFVIARKARHVSMVPAVALSGLLIAVMAVPAVPAFPVSTLDGLYLFLLGAVIMPISFGLITLGPRYIPAAEVSLIMLLETVLGPFWVWLALSEQPSGRTLLGGAVVLTALILHSLLGLRKTPGVKTEQVQ